MYARTHSKINRVGSDDDKIGVSAEGDGIVKRCSIVSAGGRRRSLGRRWYFGACSAVLPWAVGRLIFRGGGEGWAHTQCHLCRRPKHAAQLSALANGHGLLGRNLGEIDLDISGKVFLKWPCLAEG